MFQLSKEEWKSARADPASAERGALTSQIAMSKAGRGGRRTLPYAFTEHGALMAANILNSPRAVAMSVYVIRAFVKMRLALGPNDVFCILHSSFCTLHSPRPPSQPPKPEIGFHVKEDPVPYRTRRQRHPAAGN